MQSTGLFRMRIKPPPREQIEIVMLTELDRAYFRTDTLLGTISYQHTKKIRITYGLDHFLTVEAVRPSQAMRQQQECVNFTSCCTLL